MTKPKKWFMVKNADSSIVLSDHKGPLRKPNASNSLGAIRAVAVPNAVECGKLYKENEAIMVS